MAAVLCNPFGEEALRAHRIYRVLARRLAQSGVPALRFDYAGSGDSFGESTDASLDQWTGDVREAVEELRRQTRAPECVLFGLRLGGSIAALSARKAEVERVVQWDPVIEGETYLLELAVSHARYLESELGKAPGSLQPRVPPREALGHPLNEAMLRELRALALGGVAEPNAPVSNEQRRLTVLWTGELTAEADTYRTHVEGLPGGSWMNVASSTPWNSDAALNSAVVPMDVIDAVVECISAGNLRH